MMAQEKTDYLVCYNYGQGGLWAVVKARSAEEITAKYPEFEIVKETPSISEKAAFENAAAKLTFDIDDEPSGWLADMIRERNKTA